MRKTVKILVANRKKKLREMYSDYRLEYNIQPQIVIVLDVHSLTMWIDSSPLLMFLIAPTAAKK